jgi:hypothetical protein
LEVAVEVEVAVAVEVAAVAAAAAAAAAALEGMAKYRQLGTCTARDDINKDPIMPSRIMFVITINFTKVLFC